MMKYTFSVFAVCIVLSLLVGCRPSGRGSQLKTEYVEGVVTLDGKTLAGAIITFNPVDAPNGESAGGVTDQSGKYKLTSMNGATEKGAIAGEYVVTVLKVEVDLFEPDGKTPTTRDTFKGKPEELVTVQRYVIPAAYRGTDSSPLRVTVQQGKNNIPLELKTSP